MELSCNCRLLGVKLDLTCNFEFNPECGSTELMTVEFNGDDLASHLCTWSFRNLENQCKDWAMEMKAQGNLHDTK